MSENTKESKQRCVTSMLVSREIHNYIVSIPLAYSTTCIQNGQHFQTV